MAYAASHNVLLYDFTYRTMIPLQGHVRCSHKLKIIIWLHVKIDVIIFRKVSLKNYQQVSMASGFSRQTLKGMIMQL